MKKHMRHRTVWRLKNGSVKNAQAIPPDAKSGPSEMENFRTQKCGKAWVLTYGVLTSVRPSGGSHLGVSTNPRC